MRAQSDQSPNGRDKPKRIPGAWLACLACLGFAVSACGSSSSGAFGRAALILQTPDGNTQQRCVSFNDSEITGEELLLRSGWDVTLEAGNPMGSIICSIDRQGCVYPEEKCFCACANLGSCSYWAYFTQTEAGQWVYSPLGARAQKVMDGDVHAWAWVTGSSNMPGQDLPSLPALTFDSVCPPPAASPPGYQTPEG